MKLLIDDSEKRLKERQNDLTGFKNALTHAVEKTYRDKKKEGAAKIVGNIGLTFVNLAGGVCTAVGSGMIGNPVGIGGGAASATTSVVEGAHNIYTNAKEIHDTFKLRETYFTEVANLTHAIQQVANGLEPLSQLVALILRLEQHINGESLDPSAANATLEALREARLAMALGARQQDWQMIRKKIRPTLQFLSDKDVAGVEPFCEAVEALTKEAEALYACVADVIQRGDDLLAARLKYDMQNAEQDALARSLWNTETDADASGEALRTFAGIVADLRRDLDQRVRDYRDAFYFEALTRSQVAFSQAPEIGDFTEQYQRLDQRLDNQARLARFADAPPQPFRDLTWHLAEDTFAAFARGETVTLPVHLADPILDGCERVRVDRIQVYVDLATAAPDTPIRIRVGGGPRYRDRFAGEVYGFAARRRMGCVFAYRTTENGEPRIQLPGDLGASTADGYARPPIFTDWRLQLDTSAGYPFAARDIVAVRVAFSGTAVLRR